MRKICSIMLAMVLLVGALFVAPVAFADGEKTYDSYTHVDFTETLYNDASSFAGNTSIVNGRAYGNKMTGYKADSSKGTPTQFYVANNNGDGRFYLKEGTTYTISGTMDIEGITSGSAARLFALVNTSGSIGNNWTPYMVQLGADKWGAGVVNFSGTFTARSDGELVLAVYGSNNSGAYEWGWDNIIKVYFDDITVEAAITVNYEGGSVSVNPGTTYEELVSKIPYATAVYLDADKTQLATGVINGLEVTVYPDFRYIDTEIDFSEECYPTQMNPSTSHVDLSETDPAHGKVYQLATIVKRNASGAEWAHGFGFADASGASRFAFTAGTSYMISFEYKIGTALSGDVDVWTATGGLGNAAENEYLGTINRGATNGWTQASFAFTAPANATYSLHFYNSSAKVTATDFYIDNVVITPSVSATLSDGSKVNINPNLNLEDQLSVPADQHIMGYYLDEALTIPATGKLTSLDPIALYTKMYYGTVVDFTEDLYTVDGGKHSYAVLEADPLGINGTSMKYNQIGGTQDGNNAYRWNNCVPLANNAGTARYAAVKGAYYKVTYDIYKKTLSDSVKALGAAGTQASVQFDFINNNNGTEDWKNSPFWVAAEDLVETEGWETHSGTIYLPENYNGENPVMFIRIYGQKKYDGQEIYVDNVRLERIFASAPAIGGIFSAENADANAAAGITPDEGAVTYTAVDGVQYTAIRAFAEYIAPANAEGTDADYSKMIKADGTAVGIVSRHVLLGYKTTPTIENKYAMTTATENLQNCWSATKNTDGTYTVRYSLLLKDIPEEYAGTAFYTRGAIVTADGTTYTNVGASISAKAVYNEAIKTNPELKWFGGATGAVE